MLTLGTFSTLLSRELAAGYVVASPATVARLKEVRGILGMPVATVTQRAIASLLHGGVARRNTRAVHRALAQRRQVLQALPGAAIRRRMPRAGRRRRPDGPILVAPGARRV